METYNIKAKKCGNIIEIRKYEKRIVRGYKNNIKSSNRAKKVIEEVKSKKNMYKNLLKLRNKIVDIINYNFTTKDLFLTLTYEKSVNYKEIKKDFDKFIKKVKYRYGNDIKYVYVVSYLKNRNVYHFHLVMGNITYLDKEQLSKLWKFGYADVSKIKNVNAVGVYMARNITQELFENNQNKIKLFNKSRNCKSPEWVYGVDAEKIYLDTHYKTRGSPKVLKKYNSDYLGEIEIAKYELK